MRKKRNRGFTVVELVIAMAVIVIVSAAALSIILSSVTAKEKAQRDLDARCFASDAWECFRAAGNEDMFVEQFAFARGITLAKDATDAEGDTTFAYEDEKYGYLASIRVNYTKERPALTVTVSDADGDELLSISYTKGDAT